MEKAHALVVHVYATSSSIKVQNCKREGLGLVLPNRGFVLIVDARTCMWHDLLQPDAHTDICTHCTQQAI